MNELLEK